IKEIRGRGLMLCAILKSSEIANDLVLLSAQKKLVLFWLLFEKNAVRITPPLTISEAEIEEGCKIILEVLNSMKY
ncbi:MAG: aminotransferase class III-fold pyridoxal phosphate-dependent enzyme, partial [Flavobacteriaceae bacterium]|nr:aminotransferase class III-fold pyridoxal phosphate-dependent enzyme [Flavobacteriaceae bacterium]